MKTIAIHTSKGGVGKTTLTVNIAYELAIRDNKVLVIDLDDQANCSLYLGVNKDNEFRNAKSIDEFNLILESFRERKEIIDFLQADIFSKDFNVDDYIYKNSHFNSFINDGYSSGRIDVIPSSYKTKEDESLTRVAGGGSIREYRLYRALHKAGIPERYDYIILDTPPNLTAVGNAGLFASKYLLIPTQLEYFSVYGVNSVIGYVKRSVQLETDGQRGKVLGVIPMMTEPSNRNKINKFARELLKQTLPSEIDIFPEIKRTNYFSSAAKDHLPISIFAQKKRTSGSAAMQISSLTDRLIEKISDE